jgi:hypothetical protein
MSKSTNSNQINFRTTDRVSTPLLAATFLLALFVAFTDESLVTNMGVSSWVPSILLLTAVLSVFVQLFRDPIRADSSPRETADSDERGQSKAD